MQHVPVARNDFGSMVGNRKLTSGLPITRPEPLDRKAFGFQPGCAFFEVRLHFRLAVQEAIGPRKGLNPPGALDSIAFFLPEDADHRQI